MEQQEPEGPPIHPLSCASSNTLWLLPLHHKTAEAVAATFFDRVISRVSILSAILMDQGGEFMGKVMECLYLCLPSTDGCEVRVCPFLNS